MPARTSVRPATSIVTLSTPGGGAVPSRLSGTSTATSAVAATAIGTPMTKMARQSKRSISTPPPKGPIAAPTATAAAQVPSARPRWSRGNVATTMAKELGVMMAAPMPCTTRAAMSHPTSGAAAHAADPAANTPAPARNTRRAPSASVSRPAGTSSAAKPST